MLLPNELSFLLLQIVFDPKKDLIARGDQIRIHMRTKTEKMFKIRQKQMRIYKGHPLIAASEESAPLIDVELPHILKKETASRVNTPEYRIKSFQCILCSEMRQYF